MSFSFFFLFLFVVIYDEGNDERASFLIKAIAKTAGIRLSGIHNNDNIIPHVPMESLLIQKNRLVHTEAYNTRYKHL